MNSRNNSLFIILLCVFLSVLYSSCIREDVSGNTPQANFESLWRIIDEQYCFLDYKNDVYGLDWDEVYFYGTSQYREWFDSYPRNFSDSIQSNYLGKDYVNTSGLTYQILENNIGYVYCSSFSNGIGDGNLDYMLKEMELCDGLIIDVRNNGGGNLTTAQKLASRFTNEKVLVGYMSHKTGPGHSDFSTPAPVYLEPSNGIRWQRKAVVLANRRSYSSTNDFVNCMKNMPLVTIMGDTTGGGSGLPFTSEIPNGWSIRFSAAPMYDADMNQIEFGITPDIHIDMSEEDILRGKDTIIETACDFLKKNR